MVLSCWSQSLKMGDSMTGNSNRCSGPNAVTLAATCCTCLIACSWWIALKVFILRNIMQCWYMPTLNRIILFQWKVVTTVAYIHCFKWRTCLQELTEPDSKGSLVMSAPSGPIWGSCFLPSTVLSVTSDTSWGICLQSFARKCPWIICHHSLHL
jgi:hypothetical protein